MKILLPSISVLVSILVFTLNGFAQPYIVTNTADSGPGTLRQAILNANANPGHDIIQFNIPLSAPPYLVSLSTPLPPVSDPAGVTIDGYTQPLTAINTQPQGSPSNALIHVGIWGNGFDGLVMTSGNNTVQGLLFENCARAIVIDGSTGTVILNQVLGCYIGTDFTGTVQSVAPNTTGVEINNGAGMLGTGNTVGNGTPGGRNVISGNLQNGIVITDAGSNGNLVVGNYIGLDVNGVATIPNGWNGVVIQNGAVSNTIGVQVSLTAVAERNVITGQMLDGIVIDGPATSGNHVIGNFIGTDATGVFVPPGGNGRAGLRIRNGANGTRVGSYLNNSYGNLISGNGTSAPGWDGIEVQDPGTTQNAIANNYIGTDISGTVPLGNSNNGISIFNQASSNTVGAPPNIISGNTNDGIWIDGSTLPPGTGIPSNGNKIYDNYIGLDVNGTAAVPNGRYGVLIDGGAFGNKIGSGGLSPCYISGNLSDGIHISDMGTTGNFVQYCRIGIDINANPLGNQGNGIHIRNNAGGTQIGGVNPFEQNTISYNGMHGILIDNAQNNVVQGPGQSGTTGNNEISFNGQNGITVLQTPATGNTFTQNSIFSNTNLDIDLGNDGITANDGGDLDIGPNDLLNFPVINSVAYVPPSPVYDQNIISGTVSTISPQLATIEIYSTGSNPNPAGAGGGDVFLGSTTPDAMGNWAVTITAGPGQIVAQPGDFITALTIDFNGSTSEFTAPFAVYNDVNMNPAPLVQNEVSMAIIPGPNAIAPPQALLAAYNNDPYPQPPNGFGIGLSNSLDGGATWMSQQVPIPPNPFTPPPGATFVRAFDPTATADFTGSFYVAYIADDNNWATGPASGLFVHKSTDMGMTWMGPVPVAIDPPPVGSTDPNYRYNDRCQIASDISPLSLYQGHLYLVWIKDRGWQQSQPLSDIYFSRSTDGGMTWSTPVILNSTGAMGNMPTITVAFDGTIYVCWVDYNVITGGSGTIYLNESPDGGVTWLPVEHTVLTYTLPPINVSDANGAQDALAKGAAVVGVAPQNAQQVYITFAALGNPGPPVDEADILFIRSSAGGAAGTWTNPPIRVNDDPPWPAGTTDQILPWMDVKPNGIIDIAWYDRRNDPLDQNWDVYLATSIDGGQTFMPNVKVSTIPASPTPTTPSGSWMGEYLGLVSDFNNAYVGYTSSFADIAGDVWFNIVWNPELPMDWGDALDPPYQTLVISDGPRHAIVPGAPWLGNQNDNPDPEPDGQPIAGLAMGDDLSPPSPDDENGVSIPVIYPGVPTTITFEVFNAGGFVDGWIDFNVNGIFGDTPDEVLMLGFYPPGVHSIPVPTPSLPVSSLPLITVARFRVNSNIPLPPTGFASDGEVEDHEVFLDPIMWVGSADTSWTNPNNWNCGVVPDSTLDILIPAGVSFDPKVDGTAECRDMHILDGGHLILMSGRTLKVHGNLSVGEGTSGVLTIDGGTCDVLGISISNPGATVDVKSGSMNVRK